MSCDAPTRRASAATPVRQSTVVPKMSKVRARTSPRSVGATGVSRMRISYVKRLTGCRTVGGHGLMPGRGQDYVRRGRRGAPGGVLLFFRELLAGLPLQRLAYVAALANSMPTKGSSPTTRASCPGGIVYESPVLIVIRVPSVIQVSSWPETQ